MSDTKKLTVSVRGMHCSSCVGLVQGELQEMSSVEAVRVSLAPPVAELSVNADFSLEAANERLSKFGFALNAETGDSSKKQTSSTWDLIKKALINWGLPLLFALLLLAALQLLERTGILAPFALTSVERWKGIAFSFGIGIAASLSSCLAVVGALVISFSLVFQGEGEPRSVKKALRPTLFFHLGRIATFALLGGLLGLIGGSLALSGPLYGIIHLIFALLLLFMAASILGLSKLPIFQKHKLPSPVFSFLQRLKKSKHAATPLLLGAATFFIPCGFTQSQQIAALGSGSFATGALMLLFFALGTLPVLVLVGLSASWAGRTERPLIRRTAGFIIAAFALNTILSAVSLLGATETVLSTSQKTLTELEAASSSVESVQIIEMRVLYSGFTPQVLRVKKGIPVRWIIHGDEVTGCTNAIIIPSLKIRTPIRRGENIINFTPETSGIINYSCWMGMVRGRIIVE